MVLPHWDEATGLAHDTLPRPSARAMHHCPKPLAGLIKYYKVFVRLRPRFPSSRGRHDVHRLSTILISDPFSICCWARHMAAASVCKQDQRPPFLVTERCCGNCAGRGTQPRASCRWDRQLLCRLEPTETRETENCPDSSQNDTLQSTAKTD